MCVTIFSLFAFLSIIRQHVAVGLAPEDVSTNTTSQSPLHLQGDRVNTERTPTALQNGPSVVVIGCGPAGMFFLHALATKRKQLQQEENFAALAALPRVTVFERTSSPGGVWRSKRGQNDRSNDTIKNINSGTYPKEEVDEHATPSSTNMYEGLWTNGHKDAMEFFDYTFEQHFKAPQPVYMPRKRILEYILSRVTIHENIFKRVHFNSEVTSVSYNDEMKKFKVTVKIPDGTETVHYFDKCVWASGVNGKPNMVPSIFKRLSNFTGVIVHSAQMDNIGAPVEGKKIMLVGGNLSAEDLALSFIKLGAEKIYITSRSQSDIVHYTTSWPENKVETYKFTQICGSASDGNSVRICRSHLDDIDYDNYTDIHDISIVVLCTGYKANMDYLDLSLKPCWVTDSCDVHRMDEDWKMKPHPWTKIVGHVKPSDGLELSDVYMESILINNPNMVFIQEMASFPLVEIDVAAWLCLAFITGEANIPSREEMMKHIESDLLNDMDQVYDRYVLDEEFRAIFEVMDAALQLDVSKELDCYRDNISYNLGYLSQKMSYGNYPFNFGSFMEINDVGKEFVRMSVHDMSNRLDLEGERVRGRAWKTFRDMDSSPYLSLFTGMKSIAMKGKWLEIDDDGNFNDTRLVSGVSIDYCEGKTDSI